MPRSAIPNLLFGPVSLIIEEVKNVVRGFSPVQDGKDKRARL